MRHNHCEQCGVTFDNGAQFMAHICPPGPTKSAYDALTKERDELRMAHASVMVGRDDLRAQLAEANKTLHHEQADFGRFTERLHERIASLQAEANKLAAALDDIYFGDNPKTERVDADRGSVRRLYTARELSEIARQALQAYAKFKAGGG